VSLFVVGAVYLAVQRSATAVPLRSIRVLPSYRTGNRTSNICSHSLGFDARAQQIAHNLLKLPRSHFTVIDGTCAVGNLLAPFQGNAHAELIGIEINGKWAEQVAERLPQAQTISAAVEHASIAPNSISLAVLNPPYLVTNGGRMELQVFRQLCDAVMPHGVIVCIIPARSAWDRRFITA
jgi:hypothetical protein